MPNPTKTKKEKKSSRLENFTSFLKESAALITAVTALIAAMAGLLYFLFGKAINQPLFPTTIPETNCVSYERGFIQIGIMANQGLQDLYFVQSEANLSQPHLLTFQTENGKRAGETMFEYDLSSKQFILKSIVDRNCYEVPQGNSNLIQPMPIKNGETAPIKLSDNKSYKLKLLYTGNAIQGELIDNQ